MRNHVFCYIVCLRDFMLFGRYEICLWNVMIFWQLSMRFTFEILCFFALVRFHENSLWVFMFLSLWYFRFYVFPAVTKYPYEISCFLVPTHKEVSRAVKRHMIGFCYIESNRYLSIFEQPIKYRSPPRFLVFDGLFTKFEDRDLIRYKTIQSYVVLRLSKFPCEFSCFLLHNFLMRFHAFYPLWDFLMIFNFTLFWPLWGFLMRYAFWPESWDFLMRFHAFCCIFFSDVRISKVTTMEC
jgi:hypothetical protein